MNGPPTSATGAITRRRRAPGSDFPATSNHATTQPAKATATPPQPPVPRATHCQSASAGAGPGAWCCAVVPASSWEIRDQADQLAAGRNIGHCSPPGLALGPGGSWCGLGVVLEGQGGSWASGFGGFFHSHERGMKQHGGQLPPQSAVHHTLPLPGPGPGLASSLSPPLPLAAGDALWSLGGGREAHGAFPALARRAARGVWTGVVDGAKPKETG
jgi:hypothetical protein